MAVCGRCFDSENFLEVTISVVYPFPQVVILTLDAEYLKSSMAGDVLTFCPTLILFGVWELSLCIDGWSSKWGVKDLDFEGEALALLFAGEGGMTRSRRTGPRMLWVSIYSTKECPLALFILILPMALLCRDDLDNQSPDSVSE